MKSWERVSVLIGALGGVITVFVAVTQQRPASTLAVATMLLLLGGWMVIRVTTAKLESGQPRFPQGRWVAIAAAALVLVTSGILMIIPGSRTVVTHDVLGFSSTRSDVKVAQVRLGESTTHYRIAIVALNELAREELVTTIKLATQCPTQEPQVAPRLRPRGFMRSTRSGRTSRSALSLVYRSAVKSCPKENSNTRLR